VHIGHAGDRSVIRKRHLGLFFLGLVKQYRVGILIPHDVETVLVGCPDEVIVAIDKLDILPCGTAQPHVSCRRQPLIGLPDVDDLFSQLGPFVDRCLVAAVVYHDDLTLILGQRQFQDTLQTFFHHLHRDVIRGDDEADQWLRWNILWS
jgi:hypothetical protein